MTLPNVDSATPGKEPRAPSPDASTQSGGQLSSPVNASVLDAIFEDPRLVDIVERRTQATKDRRFDQTSGEVRTLKEQMAEVKRWTEGGVAEDLAVEIIERLNKVTPSDVTPSPTPAPGSESPMGGDELFGIAHESLLQGSNLSANDPRIVALARQYGTDTVGYLRALKALPKAGSPELSPGQEIQPGTGGQTPVEPEIEDAVRRVDEISKYTSEQFTPAVETELTALRLQLEAHNRNVPLFG